MLTSSVLNQPVDDEWIEVDESQLHVQTLRLFSAAKSSSATISSQRRAVVGVPHASSDSPHSIASTVTTSPSASSSSIASDCDSTTSSTSANSSSSCTSSSTFTFTVSSTPPTTRHLNRTNGARLPPPPQSFHHMKGIPELESSEKNEKRRHYSSRRGSGCSNNSNSIHRTPLQNITNIPPPPPFQRRHSLQYQFLQEAVVKENVHTISESEQNSSSKRQDSYDRPIIANRRQRSVALTQRIPIDSPQPKTSIEKEKHSSVAHLSFSTTATPQASPPHPSTQSKVEESLCANDFFSPALTTQRTRSFLITQRLPLIPNLTVSGNAKESLVQVQPPHSSTLAIDVSIESVLPNVQQPQPPHVVRHLDFDAMESMNNSMNSSFSLPPPPPHASLSNLSYSLPTPPPTRTLSAPSPLQILTSPMFHRHVTRYTASLTKSRQIWATPILPGLYLGSARHASDLSSLREYGITHIINTADDVPNYFADHYDDSGKSLRFHYTNLNVQDNGLDAGIARVFEKVWKEVEKSGWKVTPEEELWATAERTRCGGRGRSCSSVMAEEQRRVVDALLDAARETDESSSESGSSSEAATASATATPTTPTTAKVEADDAEDENCSTVSSVNSSPYADGTNTQHHNMSTVMSPSLFERSHSEPLSLAYPPMSVKKQQHFQYPTSAAVAAVSAIDLPTPGSTSTTTTPPTTPPPPSSDVSCSTSGASSAAASSSSSSSCSSLSLPPPPPVCILVHCYHGANRSVTIILALLLLLYPSWSLDECHRYLLSTRHAHTCPFPDNRRELLAFERHVRGGQNSMQDKDFLTRFGSEA